jgi:hypothetical protein
MAAMPATVRPRAVIVIAITLAVGVGACGSPSPSATAAPSVTAAATSTAARPTPVLTEGPPPTPVPVPSSGPATGRPEPTQAPGGTTQTEWGAIRDVVPDGFPVIPGAKPAEGQNEPASGWWLAEAGVDEVASWYQGALAERGFTVGDLSSPLEDGSRVLDVSGDLPECRLQLAFRPADGSTIIKVLYGAGCAGGEG